jgi:hypothetical protein
VPPRFWSRLRLSEPRLFIMVAVFKLLYFVCSKFVHGEAVVVFVPDVNVAMLPL